MDKLLAMSILSSTPSDIYGPLMNFSIFGKPDPTKERDAKAQSRNQIEEAKTKQGSEMPANYPKEKKLRPRFAVEFDGINCFETIVSH